MNRPILMDTHIWIWAISEPQKLSAKEIELIKSANQKRILKLSCMSLLELALLVRKERIHLKQPLESWLRKATQFDGLEIINISPEIAADSVRLPGDFHEDPADRIIVSTARTQNALLMTKDKRILEYAKSGNVSIAFS